MNQNNNNAARPKDLQLPMVPRVTADTDDDSSPARSVKSLVNHYENFSPCSNSGETPVKITQRRSLTSNIAPKMALKHSLSLESPQSTSSGQDFSMYAEPTIDGETDHRSTDTEASDHEVSNGKENGEERLVSSPEVITPEKPADSSVTNDSFQASSNDAESNTAKEDANLTEKEKTERKLRNIVQEVVDTERAYVDRLELIHSFYEKFREQNKREQAMGNRPLVSEETLQKVFRNLREIWRFHADTLLPALSARVADKEVPARFGMVLKKFAPFFKMYIEYTTNYDADMRLLDTELKRNEKLAQVLAELERRPECGMLTLQQHMLGPIQRVPRYELLLTSYLKHLEADDADRADSEAALKLVREAVQSGEMRMKGSEEFKRMLELNDIFSKEVPDFIRPTRSLIKEGKVIKVSARNENETAERYLFLFNDLLLVCSQIPFSASEAYKLHGAPLNTEGMDVRIINPTDLPGFVFPTTNPSAPIASRIALKTTQRQIEFAFDDEEDRADWHAAFQSASRTRPVLQQQQQQQLQKRNSLSVSVSGVGADISEGPAFIPGREAPKWVRDSEATMCMICASPFTAVINRRHHCRSCGYLICSTCSQYRIPLLYTGDLSKLQRVCRPCYDLHRSLQAGQSLPSPRPPNNSIGNFARGPLTPTPSLAGHRTSFNGSEASAGDVDVVQAQGDAQRLNVSSGPPARRNSAADGGPKRDAASDSAILKSYALISCDNGRSFDRRFLVVRNDFAIYIYRAHADIYTRETIPLPGYKVNKVKAKERVNAFKLSHPSGHVRSWLIQLNDPSIFLMWVEALEHLVCARLPPNAATST